jgi:uncharacterized damage-inducible protein DinB
MTQLQQIADSYHAATVKGAWYGPSLAELLAQITPEQAVTPPTPNANSISALLQHLLLWNERVRNTNAATPMPPWQAAQEWAEPPIPWNDLLARWNHSRDLLEAHIRNFPEHDLPKPVPGRTYTYAYLFPGIVQHAIYHSAQIALVLSILRKRQP